MKTGIYTITNLVTKKIYVGCTLNLEKRLCEHRRHLKSNLHKNIILQQSFNKYGENNFVFEVLEECEEQFLASQEHYWCNLLNVHHRDYGYNLRPTNPYGKCRISLESRIKMSLNKHENAKLRGYYYSKETIEKACVKRRKAITQYNLQGIFIKDWKSVKEAAAMLKIDSSAIIKCCKKKLNFNTAGGYKWEYKVN